MTQVTAQVTEQMVIKMLKRGDSNRRECFYCCRGSMGKTYSQ